MFLALPVLAGLVNGCARTETVTTTTTATTTTSACNMCSQATFTPTSDPTNPESHMPVVTPGPNDANGCSTLIVTCTPIAPNPDSLLTFFSPDGTDLGQAGPNGMANPVMVTIVCNAALQWTFTAPDINGNLVTMVVASGNCLG